MKSLCSDNTDILRKNSLRMRHTKVLRGQFKVKTDWITLARHKRREDVLRLRNRIFLDNMRDGTDRLFFTHCIFLDDWGMSWVDIKFPSSLDKAVLYSAHIQTIQHALFERLWFDSYEAVYAMMTKEEVKANDEHEWAMVPSDVDKLTGKVKTYTRKYDTPLTFESLGGRSVDAVRDEVFARWVQEHKGNPRDCVKKDKAAHGIGLDVQIPKIALTTADINQFILDFYNAGECEWDRPIDKEAPCLLWDAKWMEKLFDDGILKCGMGHMVGNFTRKTVPTWLRDENEDVSEFAVKDLKQRIAEEKNSEKEDV